jgi:hypothetical protein
MIKRCYSKADRISGCTTTYVGCTVCEEWKYFSNFLKWYNENKTGDNCTIDKDLLVKGNRVYSPETCLLVPIFVNTLILTSKKIRGNTPLGVHYNKKAKAYQAYMKVGDAKHKCYGNFHTAEEAFLKYKEVKEQRIKDEANRLYNSGEINDKVRDALLNWKIEIND